MDKSRRKNIVVLFLIAIFVLIFLLIIFPSQRKLFPEKIGINIKNQYFYLEIASNSSQRKIGLSKRYHLCSNCGMLFIFDDDSIYPFWMKDTYIPLDMIWINSQNQVVKIITAIETNSPKLYKNTKPAKYVIELKANEAFKLDLKVGDTIQLPVLNEK